MVPPYSSTSAKTSFKRRKPAANADSARITKNPLKKRKRDLIRLLKHADTLPADIRIAHERELASCDADLETAEREARRSQMIKKYHMVRFFERKKATRLLKKARQRLAQATSETPSEITNFEAEVHNREVDINYTLFFPLDEIYCGLYAAAATSKKRTSEDTTRAPPDEDDVNRGDPMWKAVKDAMATGQLQMLRDGKLRKSEQTDPVQQPTNATTKSHIANVVRKEREESKPKPPKRKEEKSHRMQLLERQDLQGKGGARLARTQRRAEERERQRAEAMSSDDEEDGAGFFEN